MKTKFLTAFLFPVLMLATAAPVRAATPVTTLASTDEGKFEVKTYSDEMCHKHVTGKACGTYMEFYLRKGDGSKPALVKSLTYDQFLGLFEAPKKQEKKPGFWSKLLKGAGAVLVGAVKFLVPGASQVIDGAKIAFDALSKIVKGPSHATLGQASTVGSQAIAE